MFLKDITMRKRANFKSADKMKVKINPSIKKYHFLT